VGIQGNIFYADRIGATEATDRDARYADKVRTDTPHSRRQGTPTAADWMDYVDKDDEAMSLSGLSGKYVVNMVAAFNRKKDRRILAALGGAAYGGNAGGTTINNYDAGECRLVTGDGAVVTAGSDHTNTTDTNLTVAKVRTVKNLMDGAEIDPARKRIFVVNAANLNALLGDWLAVTAAKQSIQDAVIQEGQITHMLGFDFVQTELVAANATDTTCSECYAFAQGAVTIADSGIRPNISKATWIKGDPDMVSGDMMMGAMRNEGPAVVEILLKTL
jgi:hypothetical protein